MQKPAEVSIPVVSGKAAVLTISLFESGKITFERIGRSGDPGIIEITKHVG